MRSVFRRAVRVGLAWMGLWLAFFVIFSAILESASPGSIDPGEPLGLALITGSMGFLSGVMFALLVPRANRPPASLSWSGAALSGFAATAIVQAAYLGHGDAGLVSNLQVALLFSVIGACIAVMWRALSRVSVFS